jgi:glycosyltransferase involved in cell wall biosynthesis
VVHLVPELFGQNGTLGGAERYALELARHMAEATPTRLVTFGERRSRCTTGKLEIRVIGNPLLVRKQRNNPISPELFAELRWADVVHCHQYHLVASSLAALFCRITGRRVFVTDLGGGGWDISAYVSTDRWYHGHLHISEYSRKISAHEKNHAAHVILGGVDTTHFCPDESVAREAMVLFVGRILPHKGIDDLIKALPPGLDLEIIGQPYDMRFYADLKAMTAGKRITFRHNCGERELVQAYRRALCIVLPSVYKTMYGQETRVPELLGQTLLEGMACGTPAICTDVASMPEVVREGLTGFIVPPSDPAALGERIRWLHEHPADARGMGTASREWVLEKFAWSQVVERCLTIYRG